MYETFRLNVYYCSVDNRAAHIAAWTAVQASRSVQISVARGLYLYKTYLHTQSQIQQILFVIKFDLNIYYVYLVSKYIFLFHRAQFINWATIYSFIYEHVL